MNTCSYFWATSVPGNKPTVSQNWGGDQADTQPYLSNSVWARPGPHNTIHNALKCFGQNWAGDQADTQPYLSYSVWARPGPHNTIGAYSVWARTGPGTMPTAISVLQCLGQTWAT